MKIYSWNVLFNNAERKREFAFIRDGDWDVLCLQEVPIGLLTELERIPEFVVAALDRELIGADTGEYFKDYGVILSRLPVRRKGALPLADSLQEWSLLTRAFARLMFALGLWHATPAIDSNARRFSYAELETTQGPVRVVNLHLPLLDFPARVANFERALASFAEPLPTMVCGDFNLIESPKVSLLNWLFGGHFGDALFYKRERKDMEKRFAAHGLTNPLRGRVTHPFSRSQLDHILIPREFRVVKSEVLANSHGSDHHPIFIELA